MDRHSEELMGPVTEKVMKFKARVEEPDPEKRTYGPSMEAKVRKCMQDYEELLQVSPGNFWVAKLLTQLLRAGCPGR